MESLEGRALLAAGSLDPSFANGAGTLVVGFDTIAAGEDLALQADGRIVLAGTVGTAAGGAGIGLSRLNPDGTIDPSFGTNGRATLAFDGSVLSVAGMAIQADGRIVVVGTAIVGPSVAGAVNEDFALARFTADGLPDPSFGDGGKVTIPFDLGAQNSDLAAGLAIQADGRIVVAGTVQLSAGFYHTLPTNDIGVARLNADGTLDGSFGVGGKTHFDLGTTSATAAGVVVQPDGRIVVAGTAATSTIVTTSDIAVARLLPDGSLDTSFGFAGRSILDFGGNETGIAVTLQADGRIVVVGTASKASGGADVAIARLNDSGNPDQSFDGDGKAQLSFAFSLFPRAVAVQSDGQIVVMGAKYDSTTFGLGVLRLDPNGSTDTSFGDQGVAAVAFSGQYVSGSGLGIQSDGSIVVSGTSRDGVGGSEFAVARLDGSPPPPVVVGPPPDLTPPHLVAAGSVFTGKGRKRKLAGFSLTFDEAINPATVSAGTFRLGVVVHRTLAKVVVKATKVAKASYDPATHTVIIKPKGHPAFPKGAQIVVLPGVADLAGNVLAGGGKISVLLR